MSHLAQILYLVQFRLSKTMNIYSIFVMKFTMLDLSTIFFRKIRFNYLFSMLQINVSIGFSFHAFTEAHSEFVTELDQFSRKSKNVENLSKKVHSTFFIKDFSFRFTTEHKNNTHTITNIYFIHLYKVLLLKSMWRALKRSVVVSVMVFVELRPSIDDFDWS